MDTRTLTILDYYRIRNTIAGCAMSAEGKACVEQKEPSADSAVIESQKLLAREWTTALCSQQPLRMYGWAECAPLFPVLSVEGASLSIEDIFSLGQFCNAVIKLKETCPAVRQALHLEMLGSLVESMSDLHAPAALIFRIIDESGQIRDLPEIRAIKNSILRIKREIATLLKQYTTDSTLKDALQSDMPTIRSDRQVLAVKANFRGRVKGIVHEMSQTGQTVYIEPDDVVQKNNSLIQEEYRLAQEIMRILKELTGKLNEWQESFISAHQTMVQLDSAYAAARWGLENKAVFAQNATEEKPLSLIKARHPLLGAKAVPISLTFLSGRRMLIITGPNTGGKTVTLKTAALFAALNQSGFPVPAAEGTGLPVFHSIFADIGDEQSIDQSLSTFSSHMKNVAEAVEHADEHSLILLDELGSGTDPQEGGAIAMAVLDYLLEKKAMVLVTTHHGILKNYGYTHPACTNASVDFDQNTLSPTYSIVMGVPGESHALEIARRSGLPSHIAEQAKEYLVTEQADVSALIKGLTAKHEELAQIESRYHEEEQNIREKRRRVDLKELKLRQKELELREQGYRRLASFSDESRKMLENLVRELREGEINRTKTLKVKEFISDLSDSIEKEKRSLEESQDELRALQNAAKAEEAQEKALRDAENKNRNEERDKQKQAEMQTKLDSYAGLESRAETETFPPDFAEGVDVFVNGRRGTLVRQDKNKSWIVSIGALRMSVKQKDMTLAPVAQKTASISIETAAPEADDAGIPGAAFGSAQTETAAYELRLLGMRYENAMKAVEHQIDLAVMQHLKEFSIVHGKGTGVLQQGVQEYLKRSPVVEEFHFARPEEGGFGKTFVTLKDFSVN